MSYGAQVPAVTVQELKKLREENREPFLLDVRRPEEKAVADIGGTLIPLDELPERIEELEAHRDEPIVVYCRSGARSARAVGYLRAVGFSKAQNLTGGILAWSEEIDPEVTRY